MTSDGFRRLSLELPEAVEASHMDHPDFRVRGKIFATLGYPGAGWGTVMLLPKDQQRLVAAHPSVFSPVKGTWGARGATSVKLSAAGTAVLRDALRLAWFKTAPKTLARRHGADGLP